MFLNKIRNIFVSRTQNLCPQQMLRARANGETFVSATMCPRLPGPLEAIVIRCRMNRAFIMTYTEREPKQSRKKLYLSICYRDK